MQSDHWTCHIRDVPDFPIPGILFKDLMPVLANARAFDAALEAMAAPWRSTPPDVVAGVEARGFLLGAPLAQRLRTGFVPLRKPGKLPGPVIEQRYALEYGSDALQVQAGALADGARVLLVDDVLATGGTLAAARTLLESAGARVIGAAVLLELPALGGRHRWQADAPLLAAHAG